ncbi:MAG: MarR family transcriptional regulator [Burkholderiaceae bacterium]|nr:MarR family transcriptional regulator [Burkholderiaceae bacterium]MBP7659908.1 MarR family transcriptional regulator [Burkholderiaceae bacterium]
MAGYQLRPVEFSVLAVLRANPLLTQKQLSRALNVSPPNLAVLLDRLQSRGLLTRERNPLDGRSQVLSLTEGGRQMVVKAERTAQALELEATSMLSDSERRTLIRLLQKIYRDT